MMISSISVIFFSWITAFLLIYYLRRKKILHVFHLALLSQWSSIHDLESQYKKLVIYPIS